MPGRMTPMREMPTPKFALPFAAPKLAKSMAEVSPMKPKKAEDRSHWCMALALFVAQSHASRE